MKIAIGSDHRGMNVKQRVVPFLRQAGHEVGENRVDRGILICGTGIGMSIAANKVRGVRAAPCHDSITAELSRSHNDSNVLCLSGDLLGEELIERMVKIWLGTPFEGGRHARRVDKIMRFEAER